MNIKKMIILCAAITATACFVTGLLVYYNITSKEKGNEILLGTGSYDDIAKYMEISDLENLVDRFYISEVEEQTLVDGALKGMVSSLDDPYSVFYNEEEYADYSSSSEGAHVGVGLQLSPVSSDSGFLRVVSVQKGSPAESGGIYRGDLVTAVDGIDLSGLDYESAIHLVSGPSGSNVTLTVMTGDTGREVPLIRANMQIPSVSYYMLDDDIGVIIISDFKTETADEFKTSLDKLIEEEEAKGVIIDIRDNLGTSVKSATDILDQIMPNGVLTYSIDKSGEKTEVTASGTYNNIPFAVLVNGSTAYAGEIFAGAVKDSGRAQVIGTRTFGKGVAQTVMEMPYSGSGVKLTTAEYFTPSGNAINGYGIEPDVLVEMPSDTAGLTAETDPQLQAAREGLRTHLTS